MLYESFRILGLTFLCIAGGAAQAKDVSSVTQYPIKGTTAVEIYQDIKVRAPRVANNATFAFTMIATKTDKREVASAKGCRYERMKTSAIYNFVIPRHSNIDSLSAKTRGKWTAFVDYLRKHEEGHRTIWQTCLSEYDEVALALTAPTCKALNIAREQLLNTLKRKCLKQDEAYDVLFRKDVLKHPFVADALKGK